VIGLAILFPRVPDLAQGPRRASAASAPERALTGAFQDGVVAHTLVTPQGFADRPLLSRSPRLPENSVTIRTPPDM
jgi:hypothetical protein